MGPSRQLKLGLVLLGLCLTAAGAQQQQEQEQQELQQPQAAGQGRRQESPERQGPPQGGGGGPGIGGLLSGEGGFVKKKKHFVRLRNGKTRPLVVDPVPLVGRKKVLCTTFFSFHPPFRRWDYGCSGSSPQGVGRKGSN